MQSASCGNVSLGMLAMHPRQKRLPLHVFRASYECFTPSMASNVIHATCILQSSACPCAANLQATHCYNGQPTHGSAAEHIAAQAGHKHLPAKPFAPDPLQIHSPAGSHTLRLAGPTKLLSLQSWAAGTGLELQPPGKAHGTSVSGFRNV